MEGMLYRQNAIVFPYLSHLVCASISLTFFYLVAVVIQGKIRMRTSVEIRNKGIASNTIL
jgi:hypothetical protein